MLRRATVSVRGLAGPRGQGGAIQASIAARCRVFDADNLVGRSISPGKSRYCDARQCRCADLRLQGAGAVVPRGDRRDDRPCSRITLSNRPIGGCAEGLLLPPRRSDGELPTLWRLRWRFGEGQRSRRGRSNRSCSGDRADDRTPVHPNDGLRPVGDGDSGIPLCRRCA